MGRTRGVKGALPLKSLNHISLLCSCLEKSLHFYQNILGFCSIKRPASFNFEGEWLFNYGFGIHLLQREEHDCTPKKIEINPNDNHISFQCESLTLVEKKLKEMGISYIYRRTEEWGLNVDKLLFIDPDGFMIKICSFENLSVVPLPAAELSVGVSLQAGQIPPQAARAEDAAADAFIYDI